MLLKDKVVIVTGAARGIGKAIAVECAACGGIPVIADIEAESVEDVVSEINQSGARAMGRKVDVTKIDEIESLVAEVARQFGRIDVLVNNAGILHATPIEDVSEEEWDRILDVDLKAVFFMSQRVLPPMKKNGKGKIINISSLSGRMGGYANGIAYSAAKAGVIGLTMGMARRLARYNITVNAVAPGTTETDIVKAFTPEKMAALRQLVPLGRLGKPADIANLVTFLASDRADFITGAVIDINGGMFMG